MYVFRHILILKRKKKNRMLRTPFGVPEAPVEDVWFKAQFRPKIHNKPKLFQNVAEKSCRGVNWQV